MIIKKKRKSVISNDLIKKTLLRNIFFTPYKIKGRKYYMLLKTKRYIQVGLHNKKKKKYFLNPYYIKNKN